MTAPVHPDPLMKAGEVPANAQHASPAASSFAATDGGPARALVSTTPDADDRRRVDVSTLTERQRRAFTERYMLVRDALDFCHRHPALGRLAALAEFVRRQQPGLSLKRLRILVALFGCSGQGCDHAVCGEAALLDSRGRPPKGSESDDCSPEAWQRFAQLYLTQERRDIKTCWELVANEAVRAGWTWLTYSGCRDRVQRIPEPDRVYARHGERAWKNRCEPLIQRDYTQYRVNQTWVADHHLFDFMLLDKSGKPYRPTLTAFLDMRSRYMVGWCINEVGNSFTILQAFRRAVSEHNALPDEVYCDNGKDFRSAAFAGGKKRGDDESERRRVGSQLGRCDVAVRWALPFAARSKVIEPNFKPICQRFARFITTYCGNKPDNKPERLKGVLRDGENIPTLDQVRDWFGQWLAADYHARSHSGDGMDGRTPADVFAHEERVARRTLPGPLKDQLTLIPVCGTPKRPLRVTRRGVQYQGVWYGQAEPALWRMIGQEVMLLVDPDEASAVLVCDTAGRALCWVGQQRVTGATAADLAEGLRRQRAAKRLAKRAMPRLMDARRQPIEHVLDVLRDKRAADRVETVATGTDAAVPPPANLKLLPSMAEAAALPPRPRFLTPCAPADDLSDIVTCGSGSSPEAPSAEEEFFDVLAAGGPDQSSPPEDEDDEFENWVPERPAAESPADLLTSLDDQP